MAQNVQEEQFNGLLSQYNLMDEEALRRAKYNEREAEIDENAAKIPFQTPAQARWGRLGNVTGHALSRALVKPDITEEEAKAARGVDIANQKFLAYQATPEYAALAPEQKALKYESFLAEGQNEAGNVAKAAEISMNAALKHIALEKQNLELSRLRNTVKAEEFKFSIMDDEEKRAKAGQYGTFVTPDANGTYDYMNIEGTTKSGQITADGFLEVINPDGSKELIKDYMPIEPAIQLRGQMLAAMTKADGSTGSLADMTEDDRMKLWLKLVPATQRNGAKESMLGLSKQMTIMRGVADNFEKLMGAGKNPAAMLSTAGEWVNFASNLKSTVKSLVGEFVVPIVNSDGTTVAYGPDGIRKADAFKTEIDSIKLPNGITAEAAAEYQGAIIELAYAVARANEPSGGRQLSDNDIKHSLREIGATAGDPAKFRAVIMNNLNRKIESFRELSSTIRGQARSIGMDENTAIGTVYGMDSLDSFETEYGKTVDRYNQLGEALGRYDQTEAAAAAGINMGGAPNPNAVPGKPNAPTLPPNVEIIGGAEVVFQ